MNPVEHLVWVVEDARDRTLKLLGEVPQEAFRWRPCETCNSIGSMAIHIGRVEDVLSSGALGLAGQLWQGQGWHQKLGLADDDWGWGFDKLAQAAQPSPQAVVEYLQAAQARTLPALRALSPARLDDEVPGRMVRTVAQTIAAIVNEELQHLGQMDYVRGLREGLGA